MMWNTEQWRPLDLRRRGPLGPHDGELIVLHMIPRTAARSERYYVGRMEVLQGHTYLTSCGSTVTMAGLSKRYELRWIRLQEDGGDGAWPM